LRAGELGVIGAPRAIGKSWFGMNLAVLLDQGAGWVGGGLVVQRPARVLYCQGEIDEWESCRRWQMLTGTNATPVGVAETFERWRVRTVRRRSHTSGHNGTDRYSDSEEWIDAQLDRRLEATVAEHGIDVLIIDPWAVYFAGNENSNDETEAALDKLRDLRSDTASPSSFSITSAKPPTPANPKTCGAAPADSPTGRQPESRSSRTGPTRKPPTKA
jgi:RecA-family ATPase